MGHDTEVPAGTDQVAVAGPCPATGPESAPGRRNRLGGVGSHTQRKQRPGRPRRHSHTSPRDGTLPEVRRPDVNTNWWRRAAEVAGYEWLGAPAPLVKEHTSEHY